MKNRKLFTIVPVLFALAAGAGALFSLSQSALADNKVTARLEVTSRPPKLLFKTGESAGLTPEEYKRYQTTQMMLVKSQLVLNAAIQDKSIRESRLLKKQKDPIKWLGANLKVEFVPSSEVMEISLSGNEPQELADIVNAVKAEELERITHEMRQATIQAIDLKAQEDDITQMEEASRNIAAEVAAYTLELQAPPRVRTIEDAVPPGR